MGFGKLVKAARLPPFEADPAILVEASIPKPMHGMAPRVALGQAWWDKERQAAYASTGYRCLACGVPKHLAKGPKWLEGHEQYRIDYPKGLMTYLRAVPLCNYCHSYRHMGRLEALLKAGKIPHHRYAAIIQHGDRVLAAAKIVRPAPYSGPVAEWSKWRLAVGRRRFKGLHKCLEDWVKYHERKNDDE